jgi:hypothetical protein
VIISASRRTDIPAFYLDWLMGRLKAGYCLVRSPYDASRTQRVELKPEKVECIVFWTRHPGLLALQARSIEAMGFRFYVHVTLCAYPPAIEPAGPGIETGIDMMRRLADAIGSERTLWRYDPIFIAEGIDADFHRRAFERLASGLEGATRRVTLSLLDEYPGTAARLARAGFPAVVWGSTNEQRKNAARRSDDAAGSTAQAAHRAESAPPEPYPALLADLAAMARSRGIEVFACAEPYDLSALGIGRAGCVDASLAAHLLGGAKTESGRDAGQRPACACSPSTDIGAYGTCPAGCLYCYANRGSGRLVRRGSDDEAL